MPGEVLDDGDVSSFPPDGALLPAGSLEPEAGLSEGLLVDVFGVVLPGVVVELLGEDEPPPGFGAEESPDGVFG